MKSSRSSRGPWAASRFGAAACAAAVLALSGCSWDDFFGPGDPDEARTEPIPTLGGDSQPQIGLVPASGPVGTRVQVTGVGFVGPWSDTQGFGIALVRDLFRQTGCSMIAGTEHEVSIEDGVLSGEFIVPAEGGCEQTDRTAEAIVPGVYGVIVGCKTCVVGTFRVTRS
jgi:hypothetical protein